MAEGQFRIAALVLKMTSGGPAAHVWYCGNCRVTNSELTLDFCPVCGQIRDASPSMNTKTTASANTSGQVSDIFNPTTTEKVDSAAVRRAAEGLIPTFHAQDDFDSDSDSTEYSHQGSTASEAASRTSGTSSSSLISYGGRDLVLQKFTELLFNELVIRGLLLEALSSTTLSYSQPQKP